MVYMVNIEIWIIWANYFKLIFQCLLPACCLHHLIPF